MQRRNRKEDELRVRKRRHDGEESDSLCTATSWKHHDKVKLPFTEN